MNKEPSSFLNRFRKGNDLLSLAVLSVIIISLSVLVTVIGHPTIFINRAQAIPLQGNLVDGEIDIFGRVFVIWDVGVLVVKDTETGAERRLALNTSASSMALDQRNILEGRGGEPEILVLNSQQEQVLRFDISGNLMQAFPSQGIVALSTDAQGKIYGLQAWGEVIVWDSSGNQQSTETAVGSQARLGMQFSDISVDKDGAVHIAPSQLKESPDSDLSGFAKLQSAPLANPTSMAVDYFGNTSSISDGWYTKTTKDGLQLANREVGADRIVVTQRFGAVNKKASSYTPEQLAAIADEHYNMYEDKNAQTSLPDFEDLISVNYKGNLLVSSQADTVLVEDAVSEAPELPDCKKPPIYEGDGQPLRDKRGNLVRSTKLVLPGMSERTYFTPEEGNLYGKAMDTTTGNYAIRLGIESGKWDIMAKEGICPYKYVKTELVDRMNAALAKAVDVNGNPVKTRLVLQSWEIYDRYFYPDKKVDGVTQKMNYIPPWYDENNEGTGYDLAWLVRPSRNEVPPEEKFKISIWGNNTPWVGAIDIPCELSNDSFCWWAVMHETGHAMDLGDLYQWDIPERDNLVNGKGYRSIWFPDLMTGGTDDLGLHSATHLNRTYDARVSGQYDNREPGGGTLYGAYYKVGHPEDRPYAFYFHALTETTSFELVDHQGNPMPGVEVRIVPSNKRCRIFRNLPQCKSFFGQWNSQFFAEDFLSSEAYLNNQILAPESPYTVVSDAQGRVTVDTLELTRRDKNIWFREDDGVWVDWVTIFPERAINYLILARRPSDNLKFYGFAELTQINLEAVRGKSQADIKVIMTPDLREVRIQPR